MKTSNHKWRKKRNEGFSLKCIKCGVVKNIASSFHYYIDKEGKTKWLRPNCKLNKQHKL